MQQGRQRQEQNQQQPPNQAGNPGIRVEFGFGNQPQQQGQDGTNAQTAAGPNSFFAAALNVTLKTLFKTLYSFLATCFPNALSISRASHLCRTFGY